jgi:very-short-patch-repair endonuclease
MELQSFNLPKELNSDKNIRIIMEDSKPWFVTKDIAEILEYKRTRDTISQHCKNAVALGEFKGSGEALLNLYPQTKLIPKSDVLTLISKSRKLSGEKKEELIKALGLNTNTIVLQSHKETEFSEMFIDALNGFNPDLQIITQFSVLDYRLDFYLPEVHLAIEFDEKEHKYKKEKNVIKENRVKAVLGCKFVRVNEDDNLLRKIGEIIREVVANEVR